MDGRRRVWGKEVYRALLLGIQHDHPSFETRRVCRAPVPSNLSFYRRVSPAGRRVALRVESRVPFAAYEDPVYTWY